MALAVLWSSLPTMLKFSRERLWPVVFVLVMDGWGGPHMFYEPFCKCVARFPNILFLTVHSATVVSADHPIFLKDDVFIFGVYQGGLDGIASFEVHFNTIFSADVLAVLTHSLYIWYHYVRLYCCYCLCCSCYYQNLGWFYCCSSVLYFALFKAPYWILCIFWVPLLRWSSSSLSSWLLEQTVLALCLRVLITLNVADRWWQLSHCKYKSVYVGFLYTDVRRESSGCGITIVSRKGMDPSAFSIFCCKLDMRVHGCWCALENFFFLCRFHKYKVSSTYLFHILGICPAVLMALISESPPYRC